MSKSQHGPALFDLLEDHPIDGGLAAGSPPRRVPARPAGLAERATRPVAASASAPPSVETARNVDLRGGRAWQVDGRRVHISLTSASSALVLFVIVLLVTAAAVSGRRSGLKEGHRVGYEAGRAAFAAELDDEIDGVRRQPPQPELIAALTESEQRRSIPAAGPESASAVPSQGSRESRGWVPGHTYVVVQEFLPSAAADATPAREFLAQHGISTTPVRYRSGAIQLITDQGYNHRDPGQKRLAEQLLDKVRAVGAKYFASGGGYKLEGYFRTLKAEGW